MQRTLRAGPLAIGIDVDGAKLRKVDFPGRIPRDLTAGHLQEMLAQLEQYTLDFGPAAPFHFKVWQRMRKIPWGTAVTYAEMAAVVGSPRASRAVGQACGANPLPLIVPCHRVVAQDGIGGFSGGLAWKYKLLELETEA